MIIPDSDFLCLIFHAAIPPKTVWNAVRLSLSSHFGSSSCVFVRLGQAESSRLDTVQYFYGRVLRLRI
jgi:hypothetical protein